MRKLRTIKKKHRGTFNALLLVMVMAVVLPIQLSILVRSSHQSSQLRQLHDDVRYLTAGRGSAFQVIDVIAAEELIHDKSQPNALPGFKEGDTDAAYIPYSSTDKGWFNTDGEPCEWGVSVTCWKLLGWTEVKSSTTIGATRTRDAVIQIASGCHNKFADKNEDGARIVQNNKDCRYNVVKQRSYRKRSLLEYALHYDKSSLPPEIPHPLLDINNTTWGEPPDSIKDSHIVFGPSSDLTVSGAIHTNEEGIYVCALINPFDDSKYIKKKAILETAGDKGFIKAEGCKITFDTKLWINTPIDTGYLTIAGHFSTSRTSSTTEDSLTKNTCDATEERETPEWMLPAETFHKPQENYNKIRFELVDWGSHILVEELNTENQVVFIKGSAVVDFSKMAILTPNLSVSIIATGHIYIVPGEHETIGASGEDGVLALLAGCSIVIVPRGFDLATSFNDDISAIEKLNAEKHSLTLERMAMLAPSGSVSALYWGIRIEDTTAEINFPVIQLNGAVASGYRGIYGLLNQSEGAEGRISGYVLQLSYPENFFLLQPPWWPDLGGAVWIPLA